MGCLHHTPGKSDSYWNSQIVASLWNNSLEQWEKPQVLNHYKVGTHVTYVHRWAWGQLLSTMPGDPFAFHYNGSSTSILCSSFQSDSCPPFTSFRGKEKTQCPVYFLLTPFRGTKSPIPASLTGPLLQDPPFPSQCHLHSLLLPS